MKRRYNGESHQINKHNQQNAPNLIDICRYGYRRLSFKKWCQQQAKMYEPISWVGTLLAIAMRGQQAPPITISIFNK